jgi:thiol-disulfide isomerase/thioredoxin
MFWLLRNKIKKMNKILSVLLLLHITACSENKRSIVTGLEGKPIPAFNFLLMDSATQFNTTDIASGKPAVLFIFSPHCPYCKAQTEAIIGDIKSLSNINFYLISSFPFNSIKEYYEHYQLKKYPNIMVGQDYDSFLGNYFQASGVPYIAIYNKSKNLQEVLMGNVSSRIIRNIISE